MAINTKELMKELDTLRIENFALRERAEKAEAKLAEAERLAELLRGEARRSLPATKAEIEKELAAYEAIRVGKE